VADPWDTVDGMDRRVRPCGRRDRDSALHDVRERMAEIDLRLSMVEARLAENAAALRSLGEPISAVAGAFAWLRAFGAAYRTIMAPVCYVLAHARRSIIWVGGIAAAIAACIQLARVMAPGTLDRILGG